MLPPAGEVHACNPERVDQRDHQKLFNGSLGRLMEVCHLDG